MNVQYIVAPYEADAQLAYLEKTGVIDAILTEDSDLLVFGCKRVGCSDVDHVICTHRVLNVSNKPTGLVQTRQGLGGPRNYSNPILRRQGRNCLGRQIHGRQVSLDVHHVGLRLFAFYSEFGVEKGVQVTCEMQYRCDGGLLQGPLPNACMVA